MDDKKPNLDHQWTKEIRNKFNLFIKEKKPSFQECKVFLNKLGLDLSETNLRFAAGIYIFEKYDARHTVEEIREIIADEIDELINEDY